MMPLLVLFSLVFIIFTILAMLEIAVLGTEKAGNRGEEIILISTLSAMAIIYLIF